MERRIKAAEGGILGKARVELQQHLRLQEVAISGRNERSSPLMSLTMTADDCRFRRRQLPLLSLLDLPLSLYFGVFRYNAVMESWEMAFNWEQQVDPFQVVDVRVRVLTDMAWVTMRTYADLDPGPYNVTNLFEWHNGRWYMVHHHSSLTLVDGDVNHQIVHA